MPYTAKWAACILVPLHVVRMRLYAFWNADRDCLLAAAQWQQRPNLCLNDF